MPFVIQNYLFFSSPYSHSICSYAISGHQRWHILCHSGDTFDCPACIFLFWYGYQNVSFRRIAFDKFHTCISYLRDFSNVMLVRLNWKTDENRWCSGIFLAFLLFLISLHDLMVEFEDCLLLVLLCNDPLLNQENLIETSEN